uniref:hypothetical protein n=1 Tax=Alistipes shahii TaxID=328814 RepID=UPI003FF0A596
MLVVTWLNQWAKDHILHFVVADSIATIVWIGTAITLGWMLSPGWLTAAAAAVTIVFIIIKDYWIDVAPDRRDILAGGLGLLCALLKIWLVCFAWLLLHRLTM